MARRVRPAPACQVFTAQRRGDVRHRIGKLSSEQCVVIHRVAPERVRHLDVAVTALPDEA